MSDLEFAVLGGAIESEDVRLEMFDKLEAKHFTQLAHVFDFMQSKDQKSEIIDLMIIMDKFEGQLAGTLAESAEYNVETIKGYVKRLIEKFNEREVKRITAEGFNKIDSTMAVNDDIEDIQNQLSELYVEDEKTVYTVKEAWAETITEINERMDDKREICGLTTGLKAVDESIQGLEKGEFTVIGGRPGQGKSAFMLTVCKHIGIESKIPTLVINMEMKHQQLIKRHIAGIANVPLAALKNPHKMTQDHFKGLAAAGSQLMELESYQIVNAHGSTPQQILNIIKRAHKEINLDGGLVCIDYIQLMRVNPNNKALELSDAVLQIINLSKKLGFHTIGLAQVNRECEKREDKRPKAADIADAGDIEKHADNIGFIYRDSQYNDDSEFKGIAELGWVKRREGETCTNHLADKLMFGKFDDLVGGLNEGY
jgi:replicative DNA helicase